MLSIDDNVSEKFFKDKGLPFFGRKCALPVHDFRVPKGCSTVCLQIIMASGRCKAGDEPSRSGV
jgi:hypothetical protein